MKENVNMMVTTVGYIYPMTLCGMILLAQNYNVVGDWYLKTFEKMVANGKCRTWKTAQDVMDWWIYNPPKGDPDQTVMFE